METAVSDFIVIFPNMHIRVTGFWFSFSQGKAQRPALFPFPPLLAFSQLLSLRLQCCASHMLYPMGFLEGKYPIFVRIGNQHMSWCIASTKTRLFLILQTDEKLLK